MEKTQIALISLSLLLIIVIIAFAFTPVRQQHSSTSASSTVPMTSIQTGSANVIFGVAGSTNVSALRFAISSGIRYFRSDIGNNNNQ